MSTTSPDHDATAQTVDPDATAQTVDPDATEAAVGPMHTQGRYEGAVGALATARRWLMVTKPRIIELLLVTTVPSMVVAAEGWPGTALVLHTLWGGALCAAPQRVEHQCGPRPTPVSYTHLTLPTIYSV